MEKGYAQLVVGRESDVPVQRQHLQVKGEY